MSNLHVAPPGTAKCLAQPLLDGDWIRILELESGSGNDPLVAKIRVVGLHDVPSSAGFEAVSYVWGVPEMVQQICCDGCRCDITANLGDALRQVRHPDKPRVLWVDQLCIDQSNVEEKAHQVSLMGRIYAAARRTLVCLGHKDARHALLARGILEDAYVFIQDTFAAIHISADSFPRLPEDHRLNVDDRWGSLEALLQQPWFQRGWVVQEAALASEVRLFWAGLEMEWLKLVEVYQWLVFKAPRVHIRFPGMDLSSYYTDALEIHRHEHAVALLPHVDPAGEHRVDILHVLSAAAKLHFTDARDRIFAFLGFRTLRLTELLLATYRPDYTKTAVETYRDFAAAYLRATADLDLLHFVQANETALHDDHGAWFPRWDQPFGISSCYRGGWSRMHAARKSVRVSVDSDSRVIAVAGVLFDSVSFCSEVLDIHVTKVEDVGVLWKTLTAARGADQHIYAPHALQAFTQTITQTFAYGSEGKWEQNKAAYERRLEGTTDDGPTRMAGDDDVDYFHRRTLLNCAHQRKFVMLGHGHFGSAPATTQLGDVCCVLFGAKTPFVIRKTARHGFYKLIGAVYVPSAGPQLGDKEGRLFHRLGCTTEGEHDDWKAHEYEEGEILLC